MSTYIKQFRSECGNGRDANLPALRSMSDCAYTVTVEYFECAAHAHEVSRVIEVEESAAELGSLRIHCQSSRREFGEADVAGLKRDTYVKHPALPVRLPFLAGSSYALVHCSGEVGTDVLDALVCLGRAVGEALPCVVQDGRRRGGSGSEDGERGCCVIISTTL